MKNIAITLTSILALTAFLVSCNGRQKGELGHDEGKATTKETLQEGEEGHGNEAHAEEGGHEEEEGSVEITQQQAETIGLEMKPLEERSLGNNIKVTGRLELFPQDRANISPFVGGNISSVLVIEGDKVHKGQVLAYLEHPDIITMQQEFQEKNDELVFLDQDYERKKTLYDKGVSSGKEFQMAQSKYRSTTSSVNAMRAKLRLLGFNVDEIANGKIYQGVPVISPISGFVDEVLISLGDYVAPQSKMFAVSDNSKIHVDLKVYEKDIPRVKEGQKIFFSVASRPDELLTAEVHSIGKTFEEDPKAVHIHAHIENPERDLLPGMYVEGRIVQDEKNTLAVPEEAVIKEGEKSFIFVLDDGDAQEEGKLKFKMVQVSVGVIDLGFVSINPMEPLQYGSKVVINGAYTLSSEMVKGELEHGH